MKDLLSVGTGEITFNTKATSNALRKEAPQWRDPKWVSVFDARFPNKHIYRITACDTVFGREAWFHIIVRPMPVVKDTPTYENMAKIKDAFFYDGEYTMQVLPKKKDYVSREPFTLHLWNFKGDSQAYDQFFESAYETLEMEYEKDSNTIHIVKLPNAVALISETWPTWQQIVSVKENVMGDDKAAVIINRSFSKDIELFEGSKKVVILWDAENMQLPSKFLV